MTNIPGLKAAADACMEAVRARSELLVEATDCLLEIAPDLDAMLSLADRCAVLNVNVADRHGLNETDGIIELIFAHALEDSATYRRSDGLAGPMARAVAMAFGRRMERDPVFAKEPDEVFWPGRALAALPIYERWRDGSFRRTPPRLRLVKH